MQPRPSSRNEIGILRLQIVDPAIANAISGLQIAVSAVANAISGVQLAIPALAIATFGVQIAIAAFAIATSGVKIAIVAAAPASCRLQVAISTRAIPAAGNRFRRGSAEPRAGGCAHGGGSVSPPPGVPVSREAGAEIRTCLGELLQKEALRPDDEGERVY